MKSQPKLSPETPKRGRPPVYVGELADRIINTIKASNVAQAQRQLAEEGIEVSRPTLAKLAHGAGLELHRGRPVKVA